MIRHILLIQLMPSANESQIEELKRLFESMPDKIAGVVSVEWGLNNSPEQKNQGYTHAVLMSFADEDARQRYLPHPEHEILKDLFRPLLADIIVFDYSL
ncbi:Dabb family protein [Agarivorans sp. TSD2052]|uniref:Dabb family protein n=1 Tax=Agarivorans sp. TSD2052 TaxID=2937286 RepID=UPI0020109567|nr:Dabb family protein [Agarivorans sp. TSD2052]UPW20515.1 Dabb family protein [Agarivorans sp. TSD2052]